MLSNVVLCIMNFSPRHCYFLVYWRIFRTSVRYDDGVFYLFVLCAIIWLVGKWKYNEWSNFTRINALKCTEACTTAHTQLTCWTEWTFQTIHRLAHSNWALYSIIFDTQHIFILWTSQNVHQTQFAESLTSCKIDQIIRLHSFFSSWSSQKRNQYKVEHTTLMLLGDDKTVWTFNGMHGFIFFCEFRKKSGNHNTMEYGKNFSHHNEK